MSKNTKVVEEVSMKVAEAIDMIDDRLSENDAWPLPASLFNEAIAEETGLKTPLVSYLVNLYLPSSEYEMRHGVGGGLVKKGFVMERKPGTASNPFNKEQTENILSSVDRQITTHLANFEAAIDKKHTARLFVREMADELARGLSLSFTDVYAFVSSYVNDLENVKITPGRFGGITPKDYISDNAAKKIAAGAKKTENSENNS